MEMAIHYIANKLDGTETLEQLRETLKSLGDQVLYSKLSPTKFEPLV